MDFPWEDIVKILGASVAGAVLGIEREYRSKPAGLRTLIMITAGSALFAILSLSIPSDSPDRIASNIVTGVGFVGGGVIFKEGVNVKGVTTAATIWVAAAIGMAFGFGRYWQAIITLALVLATLTILSGLEKLVGHTEPQVFKIGFKTSEYSLEQLEQDLSGMQFKYNRLYLNKTTDSVTVTYEIYVPRNRDNELSSFLINHPCIKSFDK